MGCLSCFSNPEAAESTPQPRPVATNGPPSPSNNYPAFVADPGSSYEPSGARGIKILAPKDDDPPSYGSNVILDIIKEADEYQRFGIKGAFNVLTQRHFEVTIDCSYLLKTTTRNALMAVATFLLSVARALNCNMTFYFTSYPNVRSENISSEAAEYLRALRKLWFTQNWPDAMELIKTTRVLKEHGFGSWEHKKFKPGTTEPEKHIEILDSAQQAMLDHFQGWHQKELTVERLQRLFGSATAAAMRQPKSLNSVCITYKRAIYGYQRNLANDGASTAAYAVTNVFLLGSSMQPTEIDAIKKSLTRQGPRNKPSMTIPGQQQMPVQSGPALVEGSGSQFQISSLVMNQFLDKDTLGRYAAIDDFKKGDQDVNDAIFVNETDVAKFLLNGEGLAKLLNGHNPGVDKLEIIRYHGKRVITGPDDTVSIPHIRAIKGVLGVGDIDQLQRDEDESDDDDESRRRQDGGRTTNIRIRQDGSEGK